MQVYKLLILERSRPPERRDVEAASEGAAVDACVEAVKEEIVSTPGGDMSVEDEWRKRSTRVGIKWHSKTLGYSTWRWVIGSSELDEKGKAKRIANTREEVQAHRERVIESGRRRRAGFMLRSAYADRDAVKAAGGFWDRYVKAWLLPSEEALRGLGACPASGKLGPYWTMKPQEEKR